MKNSDYWKQRFTVLENASHSYGQKTYSQIESAFIQAQRDIQGEIDKWYGRFAKNNGVTLADAKKMLSSKDLAELKWDVNQYIQYGRQNALNKQWIKELENASAKFHITRLEALQLRTQQAMEVAFGNQLDAVDKMARHLITENYYHSIFEVQRGFNIGWNIGQINENVLDKLVVKPWAADGKNFSDRIWQQKQNMVGQLHRELTRTLIQGKAPNEAIKHMEQFVDSKFKNTKYAAARLVMTEQAYFHSVSQEEAFKELDVEEFEIIATLDNKTSEVCQEMDGKHFSMKEYQAGVTAPPFHPNCRSITAPYFEDNYGGMRAARDEHGKTYYVPDNMSYKDWKKGAVGGQTGSLTNNGNSGIMNNNPSVTVTAPTAPANKLQIDLNDFPSAFGTKSEAANTKAVIDAVNAIDNADQRVVAIYKNMAKFEDLNANGITLKVKHTTKHEVTATSVNGKFVEVDVNIPKLQGDAYDIGRLNTVLHEEMHFIDCLNRKSVTSYGNWLSETYDPLNKVFPSGFNNSSIGKEIKKLFDDYNSECAKIQTNLINELNQKLNSLNTSVLNKTYSGTLADYNKEFNKLRREYIARIDAETRSAMGGGVNNLQDIYDALSGGSARDAKIVTFGHGSNYYSTMKNRKAETFANFMSLSITRPDLIEMLRKDKPDLVKAFDGLIDEIIKKGGIK